MKDNFLQRKKRLLIVPSSESYNFEDGSLDVGLLYLSSIAKELDFEVKISQDIGNFVPDYLLADISMRNFKSEMEYVAKAKELYPSLITIVKGVPFLTYNTNVIYENPYINYVITGEPEFALKEILELVPDSEISGICYSENMQSVKNETRPFLENLDILPFPDRLLDENSPKIQTIEVSRGTSYQRFDGVVALLEGHKMRFRSVESVLAELEDVIKKRVGNRFLFKAQYINFNRDWILKFCQKLIEANLNIKWSANVDVNNLDEEIISLMSKSGCEGFMLSIPSGAEDVLKNIGLNIDFEKLMKLKVFAKKTGISLYNDFILGYPWDTEKTIQETLSLAINLELDDCNFKFATPYPGTRHFAYSMMNKLFEGEILFDNVNSAPVVRTHTLSKDQLLELQKRCIKSFNLRIAYMFSSLKKIRNCSDLKRFISFFIFLLKQK